MRKLRRRSKPAKKHKQRCVRYHEYIVKLAYDTYYEDAQF